MVCKSDAAGIRDNNLCTVVFDCLPHAQPDYRVRFCGI
jgi:hypothetical protein